MKEEERLGVGAGALRNGPRGQVSSWGPSVSLGERGALGNEESPKALWVSFCRKVGPDWKAAGDGLGTVGGGGTAEIASLRMGGRAAQRSSGSPGSCEYPADVLSFRLELIQEVSCFPPSQCRSTDVEAKQARLECATQYDPCPERQWRGHGEAKLHPFTKDGRIEA